MFSESTSLKGLTVLNVWSGRNGNSLRSSKRHSLSYYTRAAPCENGHPRCLNQGLHYPLTESLDTTECINGEQRPGWYFAHVQDDLNVGILRIFEGLVSLEVLYIMFKGIDTVTGRQLYQRCFCPILKRWVLKKDREQIRSLALFDQTVDEAWWKLEEY